jgi:electron transport complex protein RnfC
VPVAGAPEQRQQRLQALKAAYNRAHKQYKQAHAALERAQRDGQDNDALAAMGERVEQLKGKANQARDAVQALMTQAKSDLGAESGKTLKTLKLEAARAEIALRRQEDLMAAGQDNADEDTLRQWETQRQQQEQQVRTTRRALTRALRAQGLVDDQ